MLAQTVGTPLEDAINGVEHMLYMSSSATADGVLNLTVTFAIGTNVDLAQVQVQNRVSQALARLPEEVRALGVTTEKRSPDITMVVHLVSPDGRYDPVYLRNYALLNVRNELARLPGAGQVTVFGAGDYAMRVWLDPEQGRGARTLGERRRAGDSRAEPAGRGGRRRRPADARSGGVSAHRHGARAGSPTRRSSATSS